MQNRKPELPDYTGQTIRGYHLIEQVAKGSQGVVYRAEASNGRIVAVKILPPEYASNQEFMKRFEGETDALKRLGGHPHIASLYDYWSDEHGAMLVLRWIGGGSLSALLRREGALSLERIGSLVRQLTSGLEAAHSVGVIHRDMKPENVLLDENGNAIIIDFGIARRVDASTTQPGTWMGSPAYLAPEQLLSLPPTAQTDIYALGVIIYEMLIGEHPYAGLPPNQIMMRVIRQPLPDVRERRPELSSAINDFLQKATTREREDRYKSMHSLWAAYFLAAGLV